MEDPAISRSTDDDQDSSSQIKQNLEGDEHQAIGKMIGNVTKTFKIV